MVLKDASAYNIQFLNGCPVFIDTLSFEKYEPGQPWVAYKQFCQHFLAPLALMADTDIGLSRLLSTYIDGIPLPLAAKLLPKKSVLKPGLYIHIFMHAKSQKKYSGGGVRKKPNVSRNALIGILNNLNKTTAKLQLKSAYTEWAKYYTFTNYKDKSMRLKQQMVNDYVKKTKAKTVLDLGSNNGLFSREAAKSAKFVISADIDPFAVEQNYILTKEKNDTNILPLVLDLTNQKLPPKPFKIDGY